MPGSNYAGLTMRASPFSIQRSREASGPGRLPHESLIGVPNNSKHHLQIRLELKL